MFNLDTKLYFGILLILTNPLFKYFYGLFYFFSTCDKSFKDIVLDFSGAWISTLFLKIPIWPWCGCSLVISRSKSTAPVRVLGSIIPAVSPIPIVKSWSQYSCFSTDSALLCFWRKTPLTEWKLWNRDFTMPVWDFTVIFTSDWSCHTFKHYSRVTLGT